MSVWDTEWVQGQLGIWRKTIFKQEAGCGGLRTERRFLTMELGIAVIRFIDVGP